MFKHLLSLITDAVRGAGNRGVDLFIDDLFGPDGTPLPESPLAERIAQRLQIAGPAEEEVSKPKRAKKQEATA